jgi:hypothetical protein
MKSLSSLANRDIYPLRNPFMQPNTLSNSNWGDVQIRKSIRRDRVECTSVKDLLNSIVFSWLNTILSNGRGCNLLYLSRTNFIYFITIIRYLVASSFVLLKTVYFIEWLLVLYLYDPLATLRTRNIALGQSPLSDNKSAATYQSIN